MRTRPTKVTIKKLYPVQHLTKVSIQKMEVVEKATLKPTGELHNKEHVLTMQALNEGINLLDGVAAGDEVEITCHVNGKETVTIEGIKRWTDLRLASLRKLDINAQ